MDNANGKSTELYQNLREEVLKCKAGDRFLTIREIMKRYGVSQSVVDRAVTRLRAGRYLVAEAGRGLFVSHDVELNRVPISGNPTEVLLMMPRWVSCDIDEFNEKIVELNAKSDQLHLCADYFDYATALPRDLAERLAHSAGLIVVPSSCNFTPQDFNVLCHYCELCPTVVFGHHFDSFGVCNVGLDDCAATNAAMYHLWNHGHRNIGLLLSEPHSKTIMERVRAVEYFATLHGMRLNLIDCGVSPGEVAATKTYDRFSRVIRDGFDFTALIGIAGESMLGAVNACRHYNIDIPQRLSMVAVAGENLTRTSSPQIDTVPCDAGGQLEAAFDIIQKQKKEKEHIPFPFENRYWIRKLIEHGSVAHI